MQGMLIFRKLLIFIIMTKGFSLIELMIVIVIASILVSIAYPSYRQYINRARRSDGQSALLDLASKLERYYSEEHTYASATINTGSNTDIASSNTSPDGWYDLTISQANASSYTLQATPRNEQARADTLCQSLTLNSLGDKGISAGPGGSPTGNEDNCW